MSFYDKSKMTQSRRAPKLKTTSTTMCHSCGKETPVSTYTKYIADHFPPKAFNKSYSRTLYGAIGMQLPAPTVRPHCHACSSAQGGNIAAVAAELEGIAMRSQVPVYKG